MDSQFTSLRYFQGAQAKTVGFKEKVQKNKMNSLL
jgi:hypothetical protein